MEDLSFAVLSMSCHAMTSHITSSTVSISLRMAAHFIGKDGCFLAIWMIQG
jgi:hypothetical protein